MDGLPYVFHNRTADSNVCNRISQFACDETLKTRLSFLDQELSVFGYPSIQTPSKGLNGVTLINVVHDLLQVYRKSLQHQSDANDNRRSSESEILRFRQMFLNVKEDLASKVSELKSKSMLESQLNQKIESLKMKVKAEQEKIRKMTLDFTSRDSQYKHEKKKLQQEIDRLLEKLNKLLQDKRKENVRSFEILNSLKRADGSRGKWITDKSKKSNESDMYRIIISNYEDAQTTIIKENEDMRKYLREMQQEISNALDEMLKERKHGKCNSKPPSSYNNPSDSDDMQSNELDENTLERTPEELFSMPYDMVKDEIERSLNAKWKTLRKEMYKKKHNSSTSRSNLNCTSAAIASSSSDSRKISELEKIIHQQQEVIDLLSSESDDYKKRQKRSGDIFILQEKSDLEKQRILFDKQKRDFDKERRDYAKSLSKLHEDRLKFENDRCSWLKNHFLQKTPFCREEKRDGKTASKKNDINHCDKVLDQCNQTESTSDSSQISSNEYVDARSSSSVENQAFTPSFNVNLLNIDLDSTTTLCQAEPTSFLPAKNKLQQQQKSLKTKFVDSCKQSNYACNVKASIYRPTPMPAAGVIINSDDDSDNGGKSIPLKYSRPSRRLSFSYDGDDDDDVS